MFWAFLCKIQSQHRHLSVSWYWYNNKPFQSHQMKSIPFLPWNWALVSTRSNPCTLWAIIKNPFFITCNDFVQKIFFPVPWKQSECSVLVVDFPLSSNSLSTELLQLQTYGNGYATFISKRSIQLRCGTSTSSTINDYVNILEFGSVTFPI